MKQTTTRRAPTKQTNGIPLSKQFLAKRPLTNVVDVGDRAQRAGVRGDAQQRRNVAHSSAAQQAACVDRLRA